MLTSWLDDPWTPPAPGYLGEVLDRTRTMRQRPAWASLERWLPMAVITRPAAAPMPLRFAFYLLVALLAVALALGALVIGSRLMQSTAVIPVGGEAVLVSDSCPTGVFYNV